MKRLIFIPGILILALCLVPGLSRAADLVITSPAFEQGQPIPERFTCKGLEHSPALEWEGAPAGTISFALIVEDPDAPGGTWDHWVLFNIPGDSMGMPEDVPALPKLNDGSVHGNNSWPKLGYGGPCPPSGAHRYFFRLYALDAMLPLKPGADKAAVQAAMDGHVLATGELLGTFKQ